MRPRRRSRPALGKKLPAAVGQTGSAPMKRIISMMFGSRRPGDDDPLPFPSSVCKAM